MRLGERTVGLPAILSVLAAGAVALTVSDQGCLSRQLSPGDSARQFVTLIGQGQRGRALPLLSEDTREYLNNAAAEANHMVANRNFSELDMIRSSFSGRPTKVEEESLEQNRATVRVHTGSSSFLLRMVREQKLWKVDLLADVSFSLEPA